MAANVSDALVERLARWGVRRIYGYPGDGIDGVIGALARATDTIDFVQARHEEMAAFMACGHARFTGELGVCLATSGPGAIHLLNGLYDAKVDRQPVLAIVGQKARATLGGDFQQEVDLVSLFKDVAQAFVEMVTTPPQLRHVIDRACRIAIAERAPTCIILPSDVQEAKAAEPAHKHGTIHSGSGYSRPVVVPETADLERAAEVLNAGERVAMLVGVGAQHAGREVLAIAERLGAGIAKALLGKGVVADALPFVTGGIGLLGTRPSYEMMRDCDTLFVVGSRFPYAEFLPEEGQARGVQIDIDGRSLSIRYPMEVNLEGDAAATLSRLLPLVAQKSDRGWRETIERNVADWWKALEERAMVAADPVNPQRVYWELSPRLPDDAMLACDSGTSVHWYSRDIRMRGTMQAAHSGSLASMASAIPYAIAAKFAYPGRPAYAFVGDGAMQMGGLNELITVHRYWQRWTDPRFVVIVLNNRDLGMVSWEQRVIQGDPRFPASQDIPDFDYAAYARMLGFDGFTIDTPDAIASTLDAALASRRPALVEVKGDPNVPPLPPHVFPDQAKNYLKALVTGDRNALAVFKASLKQLFR